MRNCTECGTPTEQTRMRAGMCFPCFDRVYDFTPPENPDCDRCYDTGWIDVPAGPHPGCAEFTSDQDQVPCTCSVGARARQEEAQAGNGEPRGE
jgi:hypothetical protein